MTMMRYVAMARDVMGSNAILTFSPTHPGKNVYENELWNYYSISKIPFPEDVNDRKLKECLSYFILQYTRTHNATGKHKTSYVVFIAIPFYILTPDNRRQPNNLQEIHNTQQNDDVCFFRFIYYS